MSGRRLSRWQRWRSAREESLDPHIPWRTGLPAFGPPEGPEFACRLCIRLGVRPTRRGGCMYASEAELAEHLATEHPRPKRIRPRRRKRYVPSPP